MAKTNEKSQIGRIVFLSEPMPNSLNEPSLPYKKAGFKV